jgi:hypothetical protein
LSDWAPRRQREAALAALDAQLLREPDAVEPRFARAGLLASLGRNEEAKAAYLALLALAPTHFGALNNLGTLLDEMGYRSAARTAYQEATAQHPDNPLGHVNLANLLLAVGEVAAARAHYETALRLDPDHAEAHQGLANLLAEEGATTAAEVHRHRAFKDRAVTTLPYRGEDEPIRLLLLVAAAGGNIPTRNLLDDRRFLISALMAEYFDPNGALPPHRLIFNAIGDADLCRRALAAAVSLTAHSAAPVINPPSAVLGTGRLGNASRLGALADVVSPRMAMFARGTLAAGAAPALLARAGLGFPLLLRSPGFHTGRHFRKVERAEELAAAVAVLPGDELLAIQYLDARGADEYARKYRVMMVGGEMFPLHMAASRDWKVHYFTADMADRPEHRAEEAAFLADMGSVLGPRALGALARIRDRLGLDYAGVDFALGANGEVLLFEANATMVVNPPDPDERWAYRRAAVERVLDGVRRMLAAKLG